MAGFSRTAWFMRPSNKLNTPPVHSMVRVKVKRSVCVCVCKDDILVCKYST